MIQISDFTKRYGTLVAVDRLNLRIERGQTFGFIGPNGAGKTTTIRFLATLVRPTSGEATILGHSVTRQPLEVRRLVGYMPDSFGLYEGMRVGEFLDLFAAGYGIPRDRRKGVIEYTMERLGLSSKRTAKVTKLSRGMKQRLCLAKTLLHDPPVLILDEPANGLDPQARAELKSLFRQLREAGKTIVLSSHVLSELADCCTTIGIIDRGKLLLHGPMDNVYAQIHCNRIVQIRFLENLEAGLRVLHAEPGVRAVHTDGNEVIIERAGDDQQLADLLERLVAAGARVCSFAAQEPTLEDVFLSVTRKAVG